MKVSVSILRHCLQTVLGDEEASQRSPESMKKIIKMYLRRPFHPIFQMNENIQKRLSHFFRKEKHEKEIMKQVHDSHNDVSLLYTLRKMLLKKEEKPETGDRELSRINDLYRELQLVRKKLSPSFRYLDLGCSEGKITKAMIHTLNLHPEQSFACDIFDQPPDPAFSFTLNTPSHLPYENHQFDFVTLFMSAHHFSHMDEMMKELLRVLKPGGYVLIREHNLITPDDSIFYNIIHALYSCVLKSEMTPYDFVESFVHAEQTSYYSKYRSISKWVRLFRRYGFKDMNTGAHGFDDRHSRTYKFDQMNGFYQLFQKD